MINFYLFLLLTVTVTNCDNIANKFSIKKCCQPNELLDSATVTCVPMKNEDAFKDKKLLPDKLLNWNSNNKSSAFVKHNISNADLDIGFASCDSAKLQMLLGENLDELAVTSQGKLVDHRSLELGDFCLDFQQHLDSKVQRIALVCDPCEQSGALLCVRTCCPMGKAYHSYNGNYKCVNSKTEDAPTVWNPGSGWTENQNLFLINKPEKLQCPQNVENPRGQVFTADEKYEYRFETDGSILLWNPDGTEKAPIGQYCIGFEERLVENQGVKIPIFDFCVQEKESCVSCILYPVCCTISNIFLILAFIAYIILPDLHNPLFGRVIMAFVVALFAAYLSMTIILFGGVSLTVLQDAEAKEVNETVTDSEQFLQETTTFIPLDETELNVTTQENNEAELNPGCVFLGFLIQFLFLHAFFWMNVIAYDIFQKFRKVEGASRHLASGNASQHTRKRFARYASYAVGLPLLISGITALVEFVPHSWSEVKPDFGLGRCFFAEARPFSTFFLFYLPLLLIQLCNLSFFVMTVFKLRNTWRQGREANLRMHNSPQNQTEHVKIGFKLFLIMGINWFFEFFSFLLHWKGDPNIAQIISYVNDCINLLQGVFIFLLLICKKEIIRKLKEKLNIYTHCATFEPTVSNKSSEGSGERKESKTAVTLITPNLSCRDLTEHGDVDFQKNAESLDMKQLSTGHPD